MNEQSAKTWSVISYALHLVVAAGAVLPGTQGSVGLLVLAFLIDVFTKDNAAGTWLESHYRWRLQSAIWVSVAYILTSPLWLLIIVPGWIAWGLISLWFLYRIVRGLIAYSNKAAIRF